VDRIEKPVGHAHRVVQRFNRALDLRLPLVIPNTKYKKEVLFFLFSFRSFFFFFVCSICRFR
jgi:hypothetical protein